MSGYALVNTKRSWYIPNLNIYGTVVWGEFEYIVTENINSVISVLFNSLSIGDNSQLISYKDLIDHKGNNLPETLVNPKVIVKQKNEESAFIVGDESSNGFKIVRSGSSSNPVPVDLYIIEMGG